MIQTFRLDFMCELGNNQDVGTNNKTGKINMCAHVIEAP